MLKYIKLFQDTSDRYFYEHGQNYNQPYISYTLEGGYYCNMYEEQVPVINNQNGTYTLINPMTGEDFITVSNLDSYIFTSDDGSTIKEAIPINVTIGNSTFEIDGNTYYGLYKQDELIRNNKSSNEEEPDWWAVFEDSQYTQLVGYIESLHINKDNLTDPIHYNLYSMPPGVIINTYVGYEGEPIRLFSYYKSSGTRLGGYNSDLDRTASKYFDYIKINGQNINLSDLDSNEGLYTIPGNNSNNQVVEIVVEFKLKDHTMIPPYLFSYLNLIHVELSTSIQHIHVDAFRCCSNLDSESQELINSIVGSNVSYICK